MYIPPFMSTTPEGEGPTVILCSDCGGMNQRNANDINRRLIDGEILDLCCDCLAHRAYASVPEEPAWA